MRRGRNLEVEPLFQEGTPLLIGRDGVKPRAGDLVLFVYAYGRRVRILRVIGRKTVLADVLEALLLDSLGRRGFEGEVLAEAAEAAASHERRDTFRSDLRDLFTFTVDPETACDFDDALSFTAGPDGLVTVYVHIADVSYYVEEGTGLDEEALRRGTSVYVPTGVEPMLPALLSSGVCSLQPGEDRKAVTVEADVASDGRVKRVVFYRSLLRSDRRLTYEELEERFRGGGPADRELTEALTLGRPLAQRLREERFARGSQRITSTEPEFHYD